MFEEPKEQNSIENDFTIKNSPGRVPGVSIFMNKIHSVNGLFLLSSVFQIILGISVVALTISGLIKPFWVATIMTVIGSITTMVGLVMLIYTFKESNAFDSLLQQAIRRVVSYQN